MALQINSLDELREMLNSLNLKPYSLDEVQDFLQRVNQSGANRVYNPDEARLRVAKLLAVVPVSVSAGVAGFASLILLGPGNPRYVEVIIAGLGIIWGVVGLITSLSVLAAFLTIRCAPGAVAQNQATTRAHDGPSGFAFGDNRIKVGEGN
jgi:hypothetical protein